MITMTPMTMPTMTTMTLRMMRIALAAAAVLAASQPGSAPAQVLAKGGCAPNALRYIVSATTQSTNSATYADIGETKLAFAQGGSKADCVVVTFTAEGATVASAALMVRALLDGSACVPGEYVFTYSEQVGPAHAVDFVCLDVALGKHTIQMQMRSNLDGKVTQVTRRTTIVHYVK